jgi:hypothetical protein
MGHERRFKRKSRTSAFPPIADIVSPRRTAWRAISLTRDEARRANIAKLPDLLAAARTGTAAKGETTEL